jgi:hypothetical protein
MNAVDRKKKAEEEIKELDEEGQRERGEREREREREKERERTLGHSLI